MWSIHEYQKQCAHYAQVNKGLKYSGKFKLSLFRDVFFTALAYTHPTNRVLDNCDLDKTSNFNIRRIRMLLLSSKNKGCL